MTKSEKAILFAKRRFFYKIRIISLRSSHFMLSLESENLINNSLFEMKRKFYYWITEDICRWRCHRVIRYEALVTLTSIFRLFISLHKRETYSKPPFWGKNSLFIIYFSPLIRVYREFSISSRLKGCDGLHKLGTVRWTLQQNESWTMNNHFKRWTHFPCFHIISSTTQLIAEWRHKG